MLYRAFLVRTYGTVLCRFCFVSHRGPGAGCDDLLDGPGRDQDDEGEGDGGGGAGGLVAQATLGQKLKRTQRHLAQKARPQEGFWLDGETFGDRFTLDGALFTTYYR